MALYQEERVSIDIQYTVTQDGIKIKLGDITEFMVPASALTHLTSISNEEFAAVQEQYLELRHKYTGLLYAIKESAISLDEMAGDL